MVILLLVAPEALCSQGSSAITGIELLPQSNEALLTIEGAVEYGYFPLSEPNRLVFDFPGTALEANDGAAIGEEAQTPGMSSIAEIAEEVLLQSKDSTITGALADTEDDQPEANPEANEDEDIVTALEALAAHGEEPDPSDDEEDVEKKEASAPEGEQ